MADRCRSEGKGQDRTRRLSISDDLPFYAPNKPPPPGPQAAPGEHLWTLARGAESRRAELRDHRRVDVELQIFNQVEFVLGRRYETRAIAMAEATAVRDVLSYSQ
jgi:hypothetical protein